MAKIDSKVVDKIRKLLALAGENGMKNNNQNEANSAMKMAAKLMEKHGLAIADIDLKTGKVDVDNVSIRQGDVKYKRWSNTLAIILAECFDCKIVFISPRNYFGPAEKTQMFIGMKNDIEMCIWYYKFLKIRIIRQAEYKFKLVRDQKSYGIGCVLTLGERLREMFIKVREEVRETETKALVVVKNKQVEDKFKELFPKTKKMRMQPMQLNHGALKKGMQDGKTMQINRQIDGENRSSYIR